MKTKLRAYLASERGAMAIEYALIAGSIGLAIVTAVGAIGGNLVTVFEKVAAGFPV